MNTDSIVWSAIATLGVINTVVSARRYANPDSRTPKNLDLFFLMLAAALTVLSVWQIATGI